MGGGGVLLSEASKTEATPRTVLGHVRLVGRELKKNKNKKGGKAGKKVFAHTHVGIPGERGVQVNERVSMNTFDFMHEYGDSSL